MYQVTGQLINAFDIPATEKYDVSYKLQIMGDSVMRDGNIKKELITLSVPLSVFSKFKEQIGKLVKLPIAFFVSNNKLSPYFPKGASL